MDLQWQLLPQDWSIGFRLLLPALDERHSLWHTICPSSSWRQRACIFQYLISFISLIDLINAVNLVGLISLNSTIALISLFLPSIGVLSFSCKLNGSEGSFFVCCLILLLGFGINGIRKLFLFCLSFVYHRNRALKQRARLVYVIVPTNKSDNIDQRLTHIVVDGHTSLASHLDTIWRPFSCRGLKDHQIGFDN